MYVGHTSQAKFVKLRQFNSGLVMNGLLVSSLTHARLPVRNGLVNKVELLRLITQKVVRTNEIARSVIIRSTFFLTTAIFYLYLSIRTFF